LKRIFGRTFSAVWQQVRPDVAIFGEKDYQQLLVVKQMVRDLDLGLRVIGAPTVREVDGVAMSSRNRYLSGDERHKAPALTQALYMVVTAVRKNASQPAIDRAVTVARAYLEAQGYGPIDYIAVRDAETLGPYQVGKPGRALAAAWLGKTRLIDNRAL
jgi:pantoate--beta-alanine ligase